MVFTKLSLFIFTIVLLSTIAKVHFEGDEPFVWTELGGLRGVYQTVEDKKVAAFLGVPFAQPPIGDLRFQKPQPVEDWWKDCCPPKDSSLGKVCSGDEGNHENWKTTCKESVRDAVKPSNSCMLTPDEYFSGFKGSEMWNPPKTSEISEDCLYLNMWVPEHPSGEVLVWIFGGGFFSGSPSLDLYNGSALAALHDIIVVNINYRLGPFGFLFLGHESPVKGNMGLLDQQLALEWINKYITAFDGKPDKVTLFGESAGSASVTAHLFASNSDKYFGKIICLSGSITNLWATRSPHAVKRVSNKIAKNLSCTDVIDSEQITKCLKEKSATDIQKAADNIFGEEPYMMSFPFVPINEDRVFFNGKVLDHINDKNFKKDVKAIFGTVNDEGTFWLPYYLGDKGFAFNHTISSENEMNQANIDEEQYKNSMKGFMPYFEEPENLANDHMGALSSEPTEAVKRRDRVGRFLGDLFFTCDVAEFAKIFAEEADAVYMYYFNKRSSANPWPKWMGVMHGYEIEYMFGQPLFAPSLYNEEHRDAEQKFSKLIMDMWANFVKDKEWSNSWSPYDSSNRRALILDENLENGEGEYVDVHEEQCKLIKEAKPIVPDQVNEQSL